MCNLVVVFDQTDVFCLNADSCHLDHQVSMISRAHLQHSIGLYCIFFSFFSHFGVAELFSVILSIL